MARVLRTGGERPCAVVDAGPDEADGELAALEAAGLGDARPGSLAALRRGRDAVATAGRVVAETAPGSRAVFVLAASLWFWKEQGSRRATSAARRSTSESRVAAASAWKRAASRPAAASTVSRAAAGALGLEGRRQLRREALGRAPRRGLGVEALGFPPRRDLGFHALEALEALGVEALGFPPRRGLGPQALELGLEALEALGLEALDARRAESHGVLSELNINSRARARGKI